MDGNFSRSLELGSMEGGRGGGGALGAGAPHVFIISKALLCWF